MERYIKTEDTIPYLTKYIPSVEAVERSKIDKAMKQIEELSGQSCMVSDGIIDEVLEILEECIGE